MISHSLQCVFIHIPKCAGSSINQDLKLTSVGFSGHSPASHHSDYKNYFSFTFVRNPYDRIASAYKYFCKLKKGHRWYKRNSIISDAADTMTFEDFVYHIPDFMKLMKREEGSFGSGIHFQPYDYFLDSPIDFLGRFEDIQKDYSFVLSKLKLPLSNLKKTNSTNNLNYKQLYDRKTESYVYYLYKQDFLKFKYK